MASLELREHTSDGYPCPHPVSSFKMHYLRGKDFRTVSVNIKHAPSAKIRAALCTRLAMCFSPSDPW